MLVYMVIHVLAQAIVSVEVLPVQRVRVSTMEKLAILFSEIP
jgi:hypothetical protein